MYLLLSCVDMKMVTGVCRDFMPGKSVQQIPPYLSLPPKDIHRIKTQKTKTQISIDQLLKPKFTYVNARKNTFLQIN